VYFSDNIRLKLQMHQYNNLYVLFESASSKYFEGTDGKGTSVAPIDKVLKVNVATIW
jgi:hypothetical protein